MKDTEHFIYSEEELKLLRENTKLGIISNFKLYKRKKAIDRFYKLYRGNSFENSLDYEYLYDLEYEIRVKKWINSCRSAWEKYTSIEHDGIGLDEFSKRALTLCKSKSKR